MPGKYLGSRFVRLDLDKEKIANFFETFTVPKPPSATFPTMEAFLSLVMADPKDIHGEEKKMDEDEDEAEKKAKEEADLKKKVFRNFFEKFFNFATSLHPKRKITFFELNCKN